MNHDCFFYSPVIFFIEDFFCKLKRNFGFLLHSLSNKCRLKMSMDQRVRHLGLLVITTWIGQRKWLLECKQVFHGSCARRKMHQIQWCVIFFYDDHFLQFLSECLLSHDPIHIIVLDKYMQWFVLWCLYSKPTLQTKNVDWGMEWLVCFSIAGENIYISLLGVWFLSNFFMQVYRIWKYH